MKHKGDGLTPNEPVRDGRLRVENFEFMISQPAKHFSWLRIDANDNCNLKCTYCRIPRSSKLLDADGIKKFLEEKVLSVQHLQFGCGMEPTIDKRLADLMVMASRAAKPEKRIILQTNGTQLHRHDHEKMSRAGLKMLSVSIDSMDEKVHAFQRGGSSLKKIVNNLEEFRKNCPHVDIQFICVVTKESISGVADVAEFAIELGVGRMAIREMMHVADDPVADPEKVAPLIVPPGEFAVLTAQLQPKLEGRGTEFAFWPIEQLHKNRFSMRKNAFPKQRQGDWQQKRIAVVPEDKFVRNADKPVLTPLAEVSHEGNLLAGKKFFILRGFYKSGTTWMGRVLNLHPAISCAGEFQWQSVADTFSRSIERSKLLREKNGLSDALMIRLDRMMKECLVLTNHPDATWVGDRTPIRISPIVLSNTKVINMVRDGRDVLISRAHQFYASPGIMPKLGMSEENRRIQLAFKRDPQFFKTYPHQLLSCTEFVRATMKSWSDSVLADKKTTNGLEPSDYFEVRYEALHRDTTMVRGKLYKFFNVDSDLAGPLAFNTKAGFENESPDKFLRKGIVGDWKNYMTPAVRKVINQVASDALVELGYVESQDW